MSAQNFTNASAQTSSSRRAVVLFFILASIFFLSAVVVVIMRYALIEMRLRAPIVLENSIRFDAYNAFYAAMAELTEYATIDGGLYSPKQGWQNLLKDGRAELDEGLKCEVTVFDETSKLPLATLKETELEALFYEMGFSETDSNIVAELFLDWTDTDDSARLQGAEKDDYDADAAFPPNRMLRSFDELYYIKNLRDYFYDEFGQPNEFYEKFASAVSILNTSGLVNLNTAPELVLRALYKMDEVDFDQNIIDAINGESYADVNGVTWATTKSELESRGATLPLKYVGLEAKILSVYVTVSRGVSKYTLSAVCTVSKSNITVTSLIEGGVRK